MCRNILILLILVNISDVLLSEEILEANNTSDWWQNAVFYQIYPRSFMDSNGDGVGDLKGIIEKLPHLQSTGITATWLSPIFQSPMVDFGYDISNFTAIHDEYGTMDDFEELLKVAKELKIKIILDFVPNHSSDKCDWFIKSMNREKGYENFYIWHDGILDKNGKRKPPNNWVSVFYGSAWTWNENRKQFYFHQFAAAQPDLNFRNPKVIEEMDKVIQFWLDKGVDGFRVDAVPHLYEVEDLRNEPETGIVKDSNLYESLHHYYTKDLPEVYELIFHWRELLEDYKVKNGGETRVMLTEAYANLTSTIDYYGEENGRKGSHLPFNFLLITDVNENSDARDILFTIQKWLAYMPLDGTANWVLGNHDRPRVGTRYGSARIDAMNLLLLTLPGVGVTYNGEEIGMVDYDDISWENTKDPAALNTNKKIFKKYTRDPCRTPFQWNKMRNAGFSTANKTWLPVHLNYHTLNLEDQKNAEKSHYKFYKRLIELRSLPTLKKGNILPIAINRRVLAYKRELKGYPTLIIVMNIGSLNEIVDLNIFGDVPEKMNVVAAGSTSNYVEGIFVSTTRLPLSPYDSLILMGKKFDSNTNRQIVKTIIKAGNVLLVGLLMYKLWNNKWTKLSLYPKAI